MYINNRLILRYLVIAITNKNSTISTIGTLWKDGLYKFTFTLKLYTGNFITTGKTKYLQFTWDRSMDISRMMSSHQILIEFNRVEFPILYFYIRVQNPHFPSVKSIGTHYWTAFAFSARMNFQNVSLHKWELYMHFQRPTNEFPSFFLCWKQYYLQYTLHNK